MSINSYRNFRREREREFDKIIEGFTPKEDKEFESMCNRYLSNEIQISDFDNYLNRSLFLDINESINNFDEYGNLINEELEWLNKAIGYVKDKSNAAFNVAISFFESIISKVKKFIKSLTKFVTDKDKMMSYYLLLLIR
jgi:CRISPR/Cas system-associated endonuclease/helicase Cas3